MRILLANKFFFRNGGSEVVMFQERDFLLREGHEVVDFSMHDERNFARKFSHNSWYAHFRRALPLIEQHVPTRNVLEVRYEDLASAPETELRRICAFAGIAFEPAMLNFKTKAHHNVNGNDMRFDSAAEIRLDTAWQTKLDAEELRYFDQHAGWLNAKLGYR